MIQPISALFSGPLVPTPLQAPGTVIHVPVANPNHNVDSTATQEGGTEVPFHYHWSVHAQCGHGNLFHWVQNWQVLP